MRLLIGMGLGVVLAGCHASVPQKGVVSPPPPGVMVQVHSSNCIPAANQPDEDFLVAVVCQTKRYDMNAPVVFVIMARDDWEKVCAGDKAAGL